MNDVRVFETKCKVETVIAHLKAADKELSEIDTSWDNNLFKVMIKIRQERIGLLILNIKRFMRLYKEVFEDE